MAKQYYYNVKNRSGSVVTYKVPELNVQRKFIPGETKRISYEEIMRLSYQLGGKELLAEFLQIDSIQVPKSIGINPQPEYYMSEQQIVELLKTGSLEQFLDCLDFAPEGVLELVKKFSVELPLSDYSKRQALKDKLGFDVDAAISNSGREPTAEKEAEKVVAEVPTGRRTTTNYKIVKQG